MLTLQVVANWVTSMVWGLGGSIALSDRSTFSNFTLPILQRATEKMSSTIELFPTNIDMPNTIFDYIYDTKIQHFIYTEEYLEHMDISKTYTLKEIGCHVFVHTPTTILPFQLLSACSRSSQNCILYGLRGSGKSYLLKAFCMSDNEKKSSIMRLNPFSKPQNIEV